jgi:hypothetical protein
VWCLYTLKKPSQAEIGEIASKISTNSLSFLHYKIAIKNAIAPRILLQS